MLRLLFNSIVCFAVLGGFCAFAPFAGAEEPKKADAAPKAEASLDYDEVVLKYFKQAIDTPSLLKYLKDRSKSDDDLLVIPELIKQLGNNKYTVRRRASDRLIALGFIAYPALRDAMQDSDPERAEMAKTIFKYLDRTVVIAPAVTRLLMKRNPPELLETLMRYLPFITDPDLQEDMPFYIEELAIASGKIPPVLVNALQDKLPVRRAWAGCLIARLGNPEQKLAARQLLKDADPNVRLRTAQGFLAASDMIAVSTLIELIEATPVSIAWQAEELLACVAGKNAPKQTVSTGGAPAVRAKEAWSQWWKSVERTPDRQGLVKAPYSPRLVLLTDDRQKDSRSQLVGRNGAVRWQYETLSKYSAISHFTAADRFLATEWDDLPASKRRAPDFSRWVSELVERNLQGKMLWRYQLDSGPFSSPWVIRPLADGSLATFGNHQTEFINRSGLQTSGMIRLEGNEGIIGIHEGRLLALTRTSGFGAQFIPNSLCERDAMSGQKIVEYDIRLRPGRSLVPYKGGLLIGRGRLWIQHDKQDGLLDKVDMRIGVCCLLRNRHRLRAEPSSREVLSEYDAKGTFVREVPMSNSFERASPAFCLVQLGFSSPLTPSAAPQR